MQNKRDLDAAQAAMLKVKAHEQLEELRKDDERGPKTLRVEVSFREQLIRMAQTKQYR